LSDSEARAIIGRIENLEDRITGLDEKKVETGKKMSGESKKEESHEESTKD
jgi:hypothetical protein